MITDKLNVGELHPEKHDRLERDLERHESISPDRLVEIYLHHIGESLCVCYRPVEILPSFIDEVVGKAVEGRVNQTVSYEALQNDERLREYAHGRGPPMLFCPTKLHFGIGVGNNKEALRTNMEMLYLASVAYSYLSNSQELSEIKNRFLREVSDLVKNVVPEETLDSWRKGFVSSIGK